MANARGIIVDLDYSIGDSEMVQESTCFDMFEQCVLSVQAGELITTEPGKIKSFTFKTGARSE